MRESWIFPLKANNVTSIKFKNILKTEYLKYLKWFETVISRALNTHVYNYTYITLS